MTSILDVEVVDPREIARQERIKACGLPRWTLNKETGQQIKTTWSCGDYRQCLRCRLKKAVAEKDALKELFISDKVTITEVSEEEAEKLTRKMRDNEQYYCRVPRPDGKVAIIHNLPRDDNTGLRPEGDIDIDDLLLEDWLADVPTGKRVVKGGKKTSVILEDELIDENEYQEFDTFAIHTDASDFEVDAAFAEAAYETPLPTTWEQIPDCINQKMTIAAQVLRQRGFVVYDVYKRDKVLVGLVPRWTKPPLKRI